MSRLKLYTPPSDHCAGANSPRLLPFRRNSGYSFAAGWAMDSITRARVLFENRCCPHCEHPQTEPVDLEDAMYGTGNLPIPGTATLVGFRCLDCDREWPIGIE